MKRIFLVITILLSICTTIQAQEIDEGSMKKATGWVNSLQLNDKAKEERVTKVIATHLAAIRDWHNSHGNMIPDGAINPTTGKKLSAMDRSVIADSSQPASIRQALLDGLNSDLTPEQVEQVLDLYTVGKVAFTLRAYKEIVPDMTPEDEKVLRILSLDSEFGNQDICDLSVRTDNGPEAAAKELLSILF